VLLSSTKAPCGAGTHRKMLVTMAWATAVYKHTANGLAAACTCIGMAQAICRSVSQYLFGLKNFDEQPIDLWCVSHPTAKHRM
jgi:hypothetical protein